MSAQRSGPTYWGGPYDGLMVSWASDDTIKIPDTVVSDDGSLRKAWAVYRRGFNWLGTAGYQFSGWEQA